MKRAAKTPLFRRAAIIGLGLIGSSLARALRRARVARTIVACDTSAAVRAKAKQLRLADSIVADPGTAATGADLVAICTPISSYAALAAAVGPKLAKGAILTDVGSVKRAAIRDLAPHLRKGAHLVPGHPIAGTENSGPEAGFAALFDQRWCILTPPAGAKPAAVGRVAEMWGRLGMKVATMDAEHHDRVLAITSHVPHLIAYTIVNTVADLESHLKGEVVKYAASGFRDFTRVAASDPVMWRDIFLENRDAVLEMLGRLYEDIALLQKAIRLGDGETLHRVFSRSRQIRRGVVQAKQD
ncbi:MAG: prephenate/arogenate dehydrogenase family protein [Rhodospirillales bacterium]|nr:prephenate/arogenate dehydrogenase family protein [Rhodospirillales bacterium]